MRTDPGNSAPIAGSTVADAVGHFHGVGAGLAVNRQDHRGAGHGIPARPEAHVQSFVLHRLADFGDVAQVNRRAVASMPTISLL